MVTTSPSAALVPVIPLFTTAERLAIAGYLAGYSGLTRQAYELDLRQYAAWCHARGVALFAVRRADIECFARDLEARGRATPAITGSSFLSTSKSHARIVSYTSTRNASGPDTTAPDPAEGMNRRYRIRQ
jgi:hypothetical protein